MILFSWLTFLVLNVACANMAEAKSEVDGISEKLAQLSVSSDYESHYDVLYRVVRSDENPNEGLVAKDPSENRKVISHVNNGGRPKYKSQFISTTKSLDAAKQYKEKYEKKGVPDLRIVKIDLPALPKNCNLKIVDLTIKENRDNYLGNSDRIKNFANASQEVLLTCDVPIPCHVIKYSEEKKSLKDDGEL